MFRKLLIANRGEIAVRIIRTCEKLGIKTVAVYSDPDLASLHVGMADQAFNIGHGKASDSYLNIAKIVKAVKASGAEAVHPGYGFLAENSEFARRCEEENLVFVGPPSKILGSVANKFDSREMARKAGVPTIPGSRRELRSAEEVEAEAARVGFPVLIKASFGGGGRGMRIVNTAGELRRSYELASAESKTAFGRSDLYLEKHLKNPRHIEVQVIAGQRRKIIHLGERECSLQRRHQKILEETPSPVLSPAERKRLLSLALKAVEAARYENAGTVEFVRSSDGEFYFLEINKRIQVEHLITEMVTGTDIVEQQLMISSGDGLSLSQDEVVFNGAAMNCRINAEDPSRNFAPTPGHVEEFVPPGGPGIRVDTALFNGAIVPEYYDSLIAKIAAQGLTRSEVIERLKTALSETIITGVETTIPLHQAVLTHRSFLQGNYHTQLLDGKMSSWDLRPRLSNEEVAMLYMTTKYPVPGTTESQQPPRNNWRSLPQTDPAVRKPLFVEGL
jgi:acetyl-CoA carboxylase, biotin carboxylase subunit